jgi:hypothetical protein
MNKKVISIAALVVLFAFGFLYVNATYLQADNKSGKKECTSSSCRDKTSQSSNQSSSDNKDIKAGGETGTYQFVTDKIHCEDCKVSMQKELMGGVSGIKDVKFGETCSVSKMTNVTVYYSAGETSTDKIASYVKDKSYDCSGKDCTGTDCNKDGKSSGKSSEQTKKSGKTCPNGCKDCKNKNGKDI